MKILLSEDQQVSLSRAYETLDAAIEHIEDILIRKPSILSRFIRNKDTYKDQLLELKAHLVNFKRILSVRQSKYTLEEDFLLDQIFFALYLSMMHKAVALDVLEEDKG